MLTTPSLQALRFSVEVNWKKGVTGRVSAPNLKGSLEVATPAEFPGGIEGKWSPEQLFLSAIAGSFMTTFVSFASGKKFQFTRFSCSAKGKLELIHGTYSFTKIDVYPRLTVPDEDDVPIAIELLRNTTKACLISHSIVSLIIYHTVIKVMDGDLHFLPAIYHEHLPFSENMTTIIPALAL